MHAANSRPVTHGPRPASPECSGHKLMLWAGFGIPDRRHVCARMCPLEYTKAAALTNNLLEIDGTWRHQVEVRETEQAYSILGVSVAMLRLLLDMS